MAIIDSFDKHTPNDWDMSETAIACRVSAVLDPDTGFEYFVHTYFPHYVRSQHKSALHQYLFGALPQALQNPKGELMAIAAPRGEAKSTIVSQLHTLYRIITNQSRYVLIVMDSIDQAYPMLDAIKSELESNLRLKSDFPNVFGVGRVCFHHTTIGIS